MDRPRIILIVAAVALVLVLALGAVAQVAQGKMGLLGPNRKDNGGSPTFGLPLTGRGNGNNNGENSSGSGNGFPFFNRQPQATDTNGTSYGELDRFSELVGYNLENQNGENVGTVDSALVNAQSGKIMYLIVKPDGANDRYVAIPWSAIKAVKSDQNNGNDNPGNDGNNGDNGNKNKKQKQHGKGKGNGAFGLMPGIFDNNNKGNPHSYALVYTRDLSELKDAPSFTHQDLDNWYEVDHSNQLRDYWRGRGADVSGDENNGGPSLVRISDARYTIVDRDNHEVGRMQDVILDLPQGRASYAVINRGGLSLSGNYIVVPFSQLNWDQLQSNRVVTLDANPDLIKGAHRYRSLNEVPYPGNDGWDQDLQDYWGSNNDG